MRFPFKLALSAVLAKNIVADLTHASQTQNLSNNVEQQSQHVSKHKEYSIDN